MKLTTFVQRPAIKDAFKKFGTPERTPTWLRGRPIIIPRAHRHYGIAGTTFDYVARTHIARELRTTTVKVHQQTSVLDSRMARLESSGVREVDKWKTLFSEAKSLEEDYIGGSGDVRRLTDFAQYLSIIDEPTRSGEFLRIRERLFGWSTLSRHL